MTFPIRTPTMLAGAAPEILGNDPRLFGKLLAAAARLGVAHHPAIDLALANPLPKSRTDIPSRFASKILGYK